MTCAQTAPCVEWTRERYRTLYTIAGPLPCQSSVRGRGPIMDLSNLKNKKKPSDTVDLRLAWGGLAKRPQAPSDSCCRRDASLAFNYLPSICINSIPLFCGITAWDQARRLAGHGICARFAGIFFFFFGWWDIKGERRHASSSDTRSRKQPGSLQGRRPCFGKNRPRLGPHSARARALIQRFVIT